eukprot:298057_1
MSLLDVNKQYCAIDIQYAVMSGLMILVATCIIWKFIRKTYIWNFKENRIQIIALLAMISTFISYLFWVIKIIIQSYCDKSHKSTIYIIMDSINYTFFSLAIMSFYWYMLYRCRHTFKHSIYTMNTKLIYFHRFIILFIPAWYGMLIYYHNNIHFYLTFCSVGLLLLFSALLTLIITFNRNLFNLLLSHENVPTSKQLPDYTSMRFMQKKQGVSLALISKHALLTTIMLMVGIFFIIVVCVLNFVSISSLDNLWIIFQWFLGCSMTVNMICVYFGFDINDQQYRKICNVCNAKMLQVCRRFVRRTDIQAKRPLSHDSVSADISTN